MNGDIITDEGVNGFNLSEVAANAVWLEDNNEIEGPLIFKVRFCSLELSEIFKYWMFNPIHTKIIMCNSILVNWK